MSGTRNTSARAIWSRDLVSRPDYSGEWHFSKCASRLQIPVPQSVEFTIEHREPHFRLERSLLQDGSHHTITLDLEIGTDNEPFVRDEALVFPSLEWDADDLIFSATIVGPEGRSTNEVRYHLDEDGTLLLADERFSGAAMRYENHWVFRKDDF